MPMSDELALSHQDRLSLEESARTYGVDLEGLSEIQRQIFLLLFGCCKIRTPQRLHLLVCYDGGTVEMDRLTPVLEELKQRANFIAGYRLLDSRAWDPLHAIHLVRRDFLMGHISSACVLGLCGRAGEGENELLLTGMAALLLEPQASKGPQGALAVIPFSVSEERFHSVEKQREMLASALGSRNRFLAHTLLIQDGSRSLADAAMQVRRPVATSELALTGILSCIESALGLMQGSLPGTRVALEPAKEGLAVTACAKTMTGLVLTAGDAEVLAKMNKPRVGMPVAPSSASKKVSSEGRSVREADVAIIGMSGRFPRSRTISEYWENLLEGKEMISFFSSEELMASGISERMILDENYVRAKPALEDTDKFDSLFFGISPKEAELIDPQQRVVLEEAYCAFEDAGYLPSRVEDVGVYLSEFINTYWVRANLSKPFAEGTSAEQFLTVTSNDKDYLATRIAYKLGLTGPALSVQTACSSSLVAVHLACEAVRAGDVSMALAGGIALSFPQKCGYRYQEDLIYSPDGHCRPFDHRAAGTLFGEGVGMVLLKKLSDALRDEDPIYAVIKGSAINNDGNKKIDFTAPGYAGQKAVITKALAKAEIDAGSMGFVEAHGTGTRMGDPLEFSALSDAYRTHSAAKQYCALGSVKGNVGHLNTAAGVASLIKAVLCVRKGVIPATVNFEKPNPQIDLASSPFYVNQRLEKWEAPLRERRAGVSSFGIGGTNAHMIIEGCEGAARLVSSGDEAPSGAVIFVLSAKNRNVLGTYTEKVIGFLKNQPDIDLRDFAYSFQIGREAFAHRLAVTAESVQELIETLERAKDADGSGTGYWVGHVKQTVSAGCDDLLMERACEKLAEFWVSGGVVEWERLYLPADRPRRLPGLPTYPFIKARHWYEAGNAVNQVESPIKNEKLTSLVPVWNPIAVEKSTGAVWSEGRTLVIGGSQRQVSELMEYAPQASVWEIAPEAEAQEIAERLEQQGAIDHLIWIAPEENPLEQELAVLQVFRLLKALLSQEYGERELTCTFITTEGQEVTPHDAIEPSHAAVHGLVGVLAKEYPRWRVRLLDLQKGMDWPVAEIFQSPFNASGDALAYRDGRWFVQQLLAVRERSVRHECYQKSGVYVIIGGSGGLGECWTRWVIEHYQAQVVWIGRSREDETIQRKLAAMPASGPVPIYLQTDATDEEALREAYRRIKEKHPKIHGVVHSAVDVFDHSLVAMDEGRFRAILAAKIDVSVRIAEVFREEPLDFVLFFSSIASWMKGGGFGGYSAGCAFVDAYARRLSRDLGCAVKVANWGYWHLGSGERVSESFKIRQQRLGMEAISPEAGMEALRDLLNGPFPQQALLKTTNPQAIESISLGEWATVYPETIPSTVARAASIQCDELEEMMSAEAQREESMDSLSAKLLHGIFQQSGLLRTGGFTVADLKSGGAFVPFYERWVEESLSVLARHHYLSHEGSRYSVMKTEPVEMSALWEEWDQQKRDARFADKGAHYALLEVCLRALSAILAGKKQATVVMFPDASLALVENIYKGNRVSDLFNDMLGDALIACIEERLTDDPSAKIRILEVGAGTGGSTAGVLAKLQGHAASIVEYCYTDVSKAFLFHAEKHFAPANPFLRTAIFDASQSLAAQGIPADRYDFVIATNVLHATGDIRQTLRNVKVALRANGVLLLNEISRKSLAAHLTFGLLDGWWLCEDVGLRMPGSPGLYPEQWTRALESEGFRPVLFPADRAHGLGQQIVLAESDGVVRQDEKRRHEGKVMARPMEVAEAYAGEETLHAKGIRYFKKLLGGALKMKSEDFDASVPLGEYGLDSIMIGQINEQLRGKFENIRGTLFFEARTIDALVDHFLSNDRKAFMDVLGVSEAASVEREVHVSPSYAAETFSKEPQDDAIAIIGLSGRYAQADNLKEFWENLQSGQDCVSEIPAERWAIEGFYCEDPVEAVAQGKSYSKWGSFVDGFADFDPLFFNITPREAMHMDPQERLFLQAAWHALEDAGYTREMLAKQYAGKVGVFAGVTRAGFEMRAIAHCQRTGTPFPGVSFSSVANRVSFVFDLKGPSMAVDTMCSSSLTAVHEACERLRRGECRLAIAGGVNLYVHPSSYVSLSASGMLSKDGVCRSFGKGSNGIVLGEGVGAVLLKPLSQAIRDRDSIHAVIRGSSINHGGKTNGYTVPNPIAHQELIRETLDKAGIHARSVSYIEAHGTGTDLGDPIEITGLSLAFGKDTRDSGFCAVGSAKSNLGHLEAAAGIAGLTKTILQMKHGRLVPSLHAGELNPNIAFEKTPFFVQRTLEDWTRPVLEMDGTIREYPRIAGISSFGAGGVNAHVIVEEFREVASEAETPGEPVMIVLSAKNELRLKEIAKNLLAHLSDVEVAGSLKLRDMAFTLQTGREAMEERIGFLASSMDELIAKLQSYLGGVADEDTLFHGRVREHRETLAMFTGDEDIQQAIRSWAAKKKFEKLLSLWVKGLSVDWNLLHAGAMPQRVHLPVYPFARERYWFDDTEELSRLEKNGSASGESQLMVMEVEPRLSLQPLEGTALKERTLHELKSLFGAVIGLPSERIDALELLENFGLDSIMIAQLNQELNRVFKKLPKTLFFEHATLNALVDYLVEQHEQSCVAWTGTGVLLSRRVVAPAPVVHAQRPVVSRAAAGSIQEPIAIIGLSAHFSQADTVDEYWELLREGRDCIREIPPERWSLEGFYEKDPKKALAQGKSNGKWGSFLDGFADFDPLFFNISPQEALHMDPHERLFLQASWEVLEDAGYTPERLAMEVDRSVGVFAGITKVGYALHGPRLRRQGENLSLHTSFSSVANRASYVLNLKGPSMPIDTMCSSSLTAIHEACERLRRGDCRMAIAGGVNLYLHPENFLEMSALQMLSQAGKCHSFGASADGMVPGEGVAALLLKPLSQAMADGDQIHAVIRGSHVNHGGRTNGYSVPNPKAQAELIRETLDKAGVSARDISYVEAHGTGTSLGDPLEIEGLTRAFRPDTQDNGYCALGSAKSNIGHLEAAAGIAGLIKIVLQMKHGQLAPSLHSRELNPNIDFEDTPFRVQQGLAEWKRRTMDSGGETKVSPRIAGLSSFGAGGANAHVIVEEFLSDSPADESMLHHPALVVLSAKNEERLVEYVKRLHDYLARKEASGIRLHDLAYTLQIGREAMGERLALVVNSKDELLEKLKNFIESRSSMTDLHRGQVRRNREELATLTADEEFRGTIDQWLERGEYRQLLDLWVKGLAFDWNRLYPASRPRVISLPTYPFAREQYWIPLEDERVVRSETIAPVASNAGELPESHLWSLSPVWVPVTLPETATVFPAPNERMVVFGGSTAQYGEIRKNYPSSQCLEISADFDIEKIAEEIERVGPVQHVLWIAPDAPVEFVEDERIIQEQESGVIQVFRVVKAFLSLGYGVQELGWTLITFGAQVVRKVDFVNPVHASLHGFVGSLAKEYPRWRVRLLDLEMGSEFLPDTLWKLPPHSQGDALARRGAEWFEQTLIPVRGLSIGAMPYRFKGVYVLIGGAGGIGEVVSRELIEQHQAQVIWIGRRAMDAAIHAQLDALSSFGPPPCYITADARNRDELQCTYEGIKEKFGTIHGVFHSALGSYDQSLAEMDAEQFRAVLSAKVDVCVRLAQVFQDEPLDFVVFFSSLASFGKARGMSSYAAACTFKDAFAHQLGKLWPCRSRVMNWGYWNLGGGARISETLRHHIEQTERILPIEPAEGMAALQSLLAGSLDQVAFLKTQASAEMRGVRLDEEITVYPEIIPSEVDALRGLLFQALPPRPHPGVEVLETWMVRLLFLQMDAMGVTPGDLTEDAATLRRKAGVLDKHARWWDEAMKELEHAEFASAAPDMIWGEWEAFKESYRHDAEMAGSIAVVDECFRKLPSILKGEILTTDVLFPRGSMEKMEALYKDNAVSRYFNDVLAESVYAYVEQRLAADPGAKIRILEIGAGTGGTTSVLLPRLQAFSGSIAEYCYTDLSQAFLMKAEERYGPAYPFLVYKVCDIEKPLAEQGVVPGSYDIVVATNVLHATKQIRQTLRHAKAALAKNGLLVMNEMSTKTVFATLLFGLIDGWSRAEDEALRIPGSPGLFPETWQRLLEDEGFGNVLFPAVQARPLGQQIIISESDGSVQKKIADFPEIVVASKPLPAPQVTEEDAVGYVRQQILHGLSQSLRLPAKSIEFDIPFSDYGVDSILGSQFINQLSEALGVSLNTTIIFDYPTVTRLSKHLAEVHEKAIKLPARKLDSVSGQAQERPVLATETNPTMRTRSESEKTSADIAVIGMSGQFPGAEDTATFWKNLVAGLDGVGELPAHYLNQERDYSPIKQHGKSYCREGGVLKYRDCFDPLFFHLSPRDAESMNLHQRLILQEGWRALEDAGYNPRTLAGSRTGSFVGSEPTGYFYETFTGASDAIVASRLSYFLDLRGPALVVNTGCSSSGVALHQACESLRNGESEMALAGGVFAAISRTALIPLSEIDMIARSGRCRAFDASGDGMVLSEGVGMVVLKRLEDAERDGDSIYGVITASGINQDGASNGITAPNGAAQEALITDVYRRFDINPETISYVEAHGTGTPLGDPIEANALTRAFRHFTDKRGYCALGSGKSNIGHTAGSSAVIGLIKVLLSMRHCTLPGLLHFKQLNPQIELEGSPFYISTETKAWRAEGAQPLTAALNSFGHSGTNVHLVIREHVATKTTASVANGIPADGVIIPLSAKDGERLKEAVDRLLDYVNDEPTADLVRLAYTLQTGREPMSHRVAFVVKSVPELAEVLKEFLERSGIASTRKSAGSLLAADEDAEVFVASWIAKRKLSKLAEAWSAGITLDWSKFYGAIRPLRLHLPAYPFARERYWIQPVDPRERGTAPQILGAENQSSSGFLLSYPEWTNAQATEEFSTSPFDERIVITCGLPPHVAARMGNHLLQTEEQSPEKRYEAISMQLFAYLKQRLLEKPKTRTLVQVLAASENGGMLLAGLTALLKTATQENPKLIGQWIEVSAGEAEDGLRAKLDENVHDPFASSIKYENGIRQVMAWHEISPGALQIASPWKDQGVYLITGGAGGIGFAFAEAIAGRAQAPVIVLIGRSELSVQKQASIQAMERAGAVIEYRRVDVASEREVQELIGDILARHGKLNGVLHSAGVNRDNYILKKSEEEFRSVLGPKVNGTVYLDRATAGMPLDFFVLFSSGAAVTGNMGQADYAAANGFMDRFAAERQSLVASLQRHGKTLSINWPLWQEGGMSVDVSTAAMMKEKTGMSAMPTAVGIEAFYQAMHVGWPQMAVMWGDLARIRQAMPGASRPTVSRNEENISLSVMVDDLSEQTLQRLKKLLGEQIKLPPGRIASQEPLERYGIDSIAITELNQRLEAIFGEISKTLFFEHQTLRELSDYFVSQYPEACARWSGENGAELPPAKAVAVASQSRPSVGHQEPIAIIGLCGRYPQAATLDVFWKNLEAGKDCVTEIPPERWPLEGFFHAHLEEAVAQRKSFGKWGGFLESFSEFDPLFFNISPREALGMDPQERLFLQAAWEVLEDAGYTRRVLEKRFGSNVGVFAGITKTGYNLHVSEMKRQGKLVYPHTSFSSVANRVSYFLNLHGPSMPVDTMCSSSLTAIHEACERLRRGDCSLAIAGGVNLYLHPDNYVELSALKMLAKDGKCRSFGKGGDGFVPGEGVGVVLLKPLAKALEDGDHIHAVIRGSHVNHGGKTNGYTIPNPNAQGSLIRETLDKAGVHARTVSYVEAHGTGTALGDPIEVTGLTQAFEKDTSDKGFCALGSAKSNLGHLEAAAGIAGLTKIILQMKHGRLVPSLHATELNPNIDFAKTPFMVQQKLEKWQRPMVTIDGETREYPRIAGLSSFGAGGANAHVILEEYCENFPPSIPLSPGPYLIPISARNSERLQVYVRSLLSYVRDGLEETQLANFAYTLQVGREAMDERLGMMVHSKAELIEQLSAFVEDREPVVPFCRGKVDHEQEAIADSTAMEAMASENHMMLLELWVSGLDLDWEKLYQTMRPRRIGLPTYPFARDRYWISSAPAVVEKLPGKVASPAMEKSGGIAMLRAPQDVVSTFASPAEKPKGVQLRVLTLESAPIKLDEPLAVRVASAPKTAASAASPTEVAPTPIVAVASVKEAMTERKLVQSLTDSLSKALYIDPAEIDVDKPFIDIGLDSIVGVEWVHVINKEHDLKLPASKVYDHPTVRKFAAFLAKTLADQAPAPVVTPAVRVADPVATALVPAPVREMVSEQKLIQSLAGSLSKALYIDEAEIDLDKPFIDIGLDSIVGVEWIHVINKEHGLELPASRVYDHPTVRKFAAYLAKLLSERTPAQVAVTGRAPSPSPSPEPFKSPQPAIQIQSGFPLQQHREESSDRIAIVGISGRYPDAEDLAQFWKNLAEARNSVREIPRERWDVNAYYDPDPAKPGKIYCKWLGALKDIDCFDPLFFMISPGEAGSMDPQHRLFLEEGYKAFEDAGYSPQSLSNQKCGVYMGIMSYEYAFLLQKHQAEFSNTGNSFAIGAARIPYFLNLKGPAIPVDTACSSSLVAVHLACQALSRKEVNMALAGGVSLYLTPEPYIGMCAAGMISADGQCKSFDDGADGFVPGEGVGALVLKRLEDAERDGDVIHGVIIGSGINQDGRTNGITAPSVSSQIELERDIYEQYNIDPASISYVETHGTGTKLGDPIELEALSAVFGTRTDRENLCALGAVKSNIGHTSAAAGVAGVHKILLSMKHGKLAPTLHFKTPNRHFDFEKSPFYVNATLKPWDAGGAPRRAAVSSFGFSGTNAHVVIEEYVRQEIRSAGDNPPEPVAIVLSAKREEGLKQIARRLHDFLTAESFGTSPDLIDLTYTLQVGREAMEERLAFTAESIADVVEKLKRFLDGRTEGLFRGCIKEKDETLGALLADESLDVMLDLWIRKRASAQILSFWVKGLVVDWKKLQGNSMPRRISLPTYPFLRQRCWFESGLPSSGDLPEAAPSSIARDKEESATDSNIIHHLSFSLKKLDPTRAARDFIPRDFEELLSQLLWGILHSMGLFESPAFTLERIMRVGRVIDKYERWMKETLSVLERSGVIEFDGENFVVRYTDEPDLESLWDQWEERKKIESLHFAKRKQLPLIEACLRSLPKILTGDIPAVEVLFPGSSVALVEGVYKGNPVSDLFNDILAHTLIACLEKRLAREPSARIRILEIGAGTGGMTDALLPKLEIYGTHILEYCYTDISKSFLFEAEEKYLSKYPFITTEVFDVEQPFSSVKIDAASYDFVIASNVLHATRNIRRTLRNVQATLRPGGLLLLNEISDKSLLGHLTFGLLDGWWMNEDDALRIPGSPALYPEGWKKVLKEEGFKYVIFPGVEAHSLGQQIVVAESEGKVPNEPLPKTGKEAGKECLSFVEDWVLAPLETQSENWTARIEARKDHSILVISESMKDAARVKAVCDRVGTLAQGQECRWEVSHMPIDVGEKPRVEVADIRRFLPNSESPLAIFVFLPPLSKGASVRLELAYSCVQSVMAAAPAKSIRLYCCYQEEETDVWLHGEALAGLFKSAMLESIYHRFRTMAYDGRLAAERQVALRMIQEWLCDDTDALTPASVPMVRYADGERFELRVEEVREIAKAQKRIGFRQGGTYLMVGALGPTGALICEELGRRYQARLVIFSRRDEDEVQNQLARMIDAGASVIYHSVDILNRADLDRAMHSLKDDGVEFNGVIHMARKVSDAPIVAKSFHGFIETMSAKVEGTWNIDIVTAGEPLDFFMTYSSMAAFGIQGSPDYAFSAAFQNSLVRDREGLVKRGLRSGASRSICWGQWEVDGAVKPEKMPDRLERLRQMGMEFINVSSAMTLMGVCLNGRAKVVGFVAVSDGRRVRQGMGLEALNPDVNAGIFQAIAAFEKGEWSQEQFADFLDTLPDREINESAQREIVRVISRSNHQPLEAVASISLPPVESAKKSDRNSIEQALGAAVKKVLKIPEEDLDWDAALQSYGLDSIIAMQLATALEKALKFPIQPRWLIEFPTLNQLLGKLIQEDEFKEILDAHD